MSIKKVSYSKLLQEAMADFDTTKTVDVTGPMTKQILGYKGDGELKTTSDAASILERYYFSDENDRDVSIIGEDDRTDFAEPDRNEVDDVPSDNINKTKKDIEDELTEADDMDEEESEADTEESEVNANESEVTEAEEAVIEKLISEMEEDDDEEEGEEDEDLDADKEVSQEMGPVGNPKTADQDSEDSGSDDDLSEAFEIFREEIEADDDEEDIDSDDVEV